MTLDDAVRFANNERPANLRRRHNMRGPGRARRENRVRSDADAAGALLAEGGDAAGALLAVGGDAFVIVDDDGVEAFIEVEGEGDVGASWDGVGGGNGDGDMGTVPPSPALPYVRRALGLDDEGGDVEEGSEASYRPPPPTPPTTPPASPSPGFAVPPPSGPVDLLEPSLMPSLEKRAGQRISMSTEEAGRLPQSTMRSLSDPPPPAQSPFDFLAFARPGPRAVKEKELTWR